MTNYEILLDDIEQKGILYIQTRSSKQPAMTMRDDGEYAIFFDEAAFETTAKRYVALLHEDCHCETGVIYNINTPLATIRKYERRTWRHAVLTRLPFAELYYALQEGITERWELAEHFEVTEEFIDMALDVYRRQGLLRG